MNANPHIVLLTDFSDASYAAFAPARELAQRLGAKVTVAHVVIEQAAIPHGAPLAPPVPMPPQDVDALMRQAWSDVENAQGKLGSGVEVAGEVLSGDKVHETVCRWAKEQGADFIAIATHGRTGLRRALMGSVAEAVLRHSSVPVVVFPLPD